MKWFQLPAFVYLNKENLKWIVWSTIGLWLEYTQIQPIWDAAKSVYENEFIVIAFLLPLPMQGSSSSQEHSLKDILCERGSTATPYHSLILLSGHIQHIKAVKSLLGAFVPPRGLWNWQQWCHLTTAVSLYSPCQIRMAKGPYMTK